MEDGWMIDGCVGLSIDRQIDRLIVILRTDGTMDGQILTLRMDGRMDVCVNRWVSRYDVENREDTINVILRIDVENK